MTKAYTVDSVNKRSVLTPAGQFKNIYEVAFTTDSGVRDTLEVEEKDYTPEKLELTLDEIVSTHEAVMTIGDKD